MRSEAITKYELKPQAIAEYQNFRSGCRFTIIYVRPKGLYNGFGAWINDVGGTAGYDD